MVRINKFLASCNLGSRRSVEDIIKSGRVSVNGEVITSLSVSIDPEKDEVKVGHKKVEHETKKIFIMMNKPVGYIVSKKDEFNRKTIYKLLPDFAQNLHPVGRLDYDSEGILLLTNDGELTNKITHPKYQVEKTYKVIVKGKIPKDKIIILRNGVKLDDGITQTAKVFLKSSTDEKSELRIGIKEGKNRQIRRMLEKIGHEVLSLKRLQIGELKLEKLPQGSWRFLKDKEILLLLKTYHKNKI
jgi:23S rRNA pseudouridine2605 synthase